MLVKASRIQLPQIEKASHVQIESIFGATTNLVGNGFNFHQHHNNVNGDAAHAHEIPLRPTGLNNSPRDNIFEETPKGPRKKQTMAIAGNSAGLRNNPVVSLGRDSGNAVQSFMKFANETSLHGWKYVQTSSPLERFCWLVLLIVALITASVLVYLAVSDFLSHSVSTNMDSLSTPYDNLYFPAITVCNMNFMQRSVLQKYNVQHNDTLIEVFDRMINTGSKEDFTEEEMAMFEDIEKMTNGSSRLKMEGQPKCHNMFLQYHWKNKKVPFNDGKTTMHYGQTTDESVCCQIFPGMLKEENSVEFDVTNITFWVKEENPWQIIFDGYKKGIKPGKQGVEVLIDVETYEYFSVHSSGSEGVLVLIQHYRDIPLMRKESFVLAPGTEADVGLSITEIITTQAAIQRFTPQERDCYVHDEVNLKSLPLKKGYRMSMKNCLYDKALQATKAMCGCKPPFYVLGALGNITTCQGTQLDCAYKIFDDPNGNFVYENENGTELQNCLAPCNDQIYDSRITLATYPNKAMFSKRPEICSVVKKLLKICQGWIDIQAVGAFRYGDELKIKKKVLTDMYPTMCTHLLAIFGDNSTNTPNITCPNVRRDLQNYNQYREFFDVLYKYAKENLLWLNVYVKDSYASRIIRDEKMTRTRFVANVGGLLGLCMGFSFVSLAEIIYFCFKRNASSGSMQSSVDWKAKNCSKNLESNSHASGSPKITEDEGNATHNDVNSICSDASEEICETKNHATAQKIYKALPNEGSPNECIVKEKTP